MVYCSSLEDVVGMRRVLDADMTAHSEPTDSIHSDLAIFLFQELAPGAQIRSIARMGL